MITVILNCYKRTQYLEEQLQAIKDQSIAASDIWIWYNSPGEHEDLSKYGLKVMYSTHNFKYHARFAAGLLAQTEYVAFFDDDTIPGSNWFKNCMDTIESGYDGILGTSGVCPKTNKSYIPATKYGWNAVKLDTVKEVDLVGHAWFMRKDYLRYLWYEEPCSWENGEDMQLSYMAQKYGGIKTYVPPHPVSDKSMWGSLPVQGIKYGSDDNASWTKNKLHFKQRNKVVTDQVKLGWKLLCDV